MTRLVEGCLPEAPGATGTHSLEAMLEGSAAHATPPATLDLTHLIRPAKDQGEYGTCVGFGTARACETNARQKANSTFPDLSELHGYKQSRAIQGLIDHPVDGSTTAAGLEGYRRGGFLFASEMPYEPSKRFGGNKLGQGQAALRRAGVRSHRITEAPGPAMEQALQVAMAGGLGVVGGWKVGEGFEQWRPSLGPFDGADRGPMVGHCMSPIDYPTGQPRIINSWGRDVGEQGLWTVTWDWLMSAMSLWIVEFVPLA